MINGQNFRIDVECGNGGGPNILLTAPVLEEQGLGKDAKQVPLQLSISNREFEETYECRRNYCMAFGFPSIELIAAMRSGLNMEIKHRSVHLADISLRGSNVAIGHLSPCLGADVY